MAKNKFPNSGSLDLSEFTKELRDGGNAQVEKVTEAKTSVAPRSMPLQKSKEKDVTINVRASYRNRLRLLSAKTGTPIQELVEECLEEFLNEKGE